jgi:hypothetical protein
MSLPPRQGECTGNYLSKLQSAGILQQRKVRHEARRSQQAFMSCKWSAKNGGNTYKYKMTFEWQLINEPGTARQHKQGKKVMIS